MLTLKCLRVWEWAHAQKSSGSRLDSSVCTVCVWGLTDEGTNHPKIPKICPGAYIFQRPFLRGLFLEGLIFGGAYLRREIRVSKSIGLAL